MTMPTDRERDRRSLQDLAKLANSTRGLTPAPPPMISAPSSKSLGSGDDSGIVDLAAASAADPQAAARAQSTPLASAGLFDDVGGAASPAPATVKSMPPASVRPSTPAPLSAPPVSAAPVSAALTAPLAPSALASAPALAVAPAPVVEITAKPSEKKSRALPLALVGIVAVSAIAASGFLFMKQKSVQAEATMAKTETPAAPVEVKTAPATPVETTPAPEATLDPNSLPSAETAPAEGAKVAMTAKTNGRTAAKTTAPAVKETAPAKEATAKLSEKDLPTTPAGPAGALGDEMRKAVGDKEKADQQAAAASGPQFAAGSVPQKPSQGAVTGAVGAVLPEARACLGPDDPVSRAAIVFASEGAVQSVRVSGHAAGKPAEACIKSALMKAKVAPFAEPSYTANITVRH